MGSAAPSRAPGRTSCLMKRGQDVGYQSYMLIFPETAKARHDFGDRSHPSRGGGLSLAAARSLPD
jgi:hypothetical protein